MKRALAVISLVTLAALVSAQDKKPEKKPEVKKPEVVARVRHPSFVTSVAAARKLLLAGLDDGSLVFLGEDRAPIRRDDPALSLGARVVSVGIDLDERVILAASEDGRLVVLDGQTFEQLGKHAAGGALLRAALTQDGDAVYYTGGADRKLVKLSAPKLEPVASVAAAGSGAIALAVSRDGARVATGYVDGTVALWSAKLEKLRSWRAADEKQSVSGVAFDASGERIATGATDGTVRVWGVDGERRAECKLHTDSVEALAFLPDGRLVTAGLEGRTTFWKAATFELDQSFTRYRGMVTSLALVPDGATILRGGNLLELVPVARPALPILLDGWGGSITAVATANGTTATASLDGTVILWDLARGAMKTKLRVKDWATALAMNDDLLAVGLADGSVEVIAGEKRWAFRAHAGEVTGARFAGDGLVTSGLDGKVVFWTLRGARAAEVEAGAPITCLALDPTHGLVAAGTVAGEIVLVDAKAREKRAVIRGRPSGLRALAFSPDGSMLAAAAHDGSITLHDPEGKKPPRTRSGLGYPEARAVAFAPSGALVAVAYANGEFLLLEPTSLELRTGGNARAELEAVVFLDDATFAVAGADQTLTLIRWKP